MSSQLVDLLRRIRARLPNAGGAWDEIKSEIDQHLASASGAILRSDEDPLDLDCDLGGES